MFEAIAKSNGEFVVSVEIGEPRSLFIFPALTKRNSDVQCDPFIVDIDDGEIRSDEGKYCLTCTIHFCDNLFKLR